MGIIRSFKGMTPQYGSVAPTVPAKEKGTMYFVTDTGDDTGVIQSSYIFGENGWVQAGSGADVVTALSISGNTLSYVDEEGNQTDIDLSLYLDDTNLARLTSGTLNNATGIATFTRDDATTFTVDLSSLMLNTVADLTDTDVVTQTPDNKSLLVWDGTNWVVGYAPAVTFKTSPTVSGTYTQTYDVAETQIMNGFVRLTNGDILGAQQSDSGGNIIRSTDGGATWASTGVPCPYQYTSLGNWYPKLFNGYIVARTTSNGTAYAPEDLSSGFTETVAAVPRGTVTFGSTEYAVSYNQYDTTLHYSTDGVNWQSSSGKTGLGINGHMINPWDGNHIVSNGTYAITNMGDDSGVVVFTSITDAGTFLAYPEGAVQGIRFAMTELGGELYLLTGTNTPSYEAKVWKLNPSGTGWIHVETYTGFAGSLNSTADGYLVINHLDFNVSPVVNQVSLYDPDTQTSTATDASLENTHWDDVSIDSSQTILIVGSSQDSIEIGVFNTTSSAGNTSARPYTIDELDNTAVDTKVNGDALVWDATANMWVPGTSATAHQNLTGTSLDDCHPISSITGLQAELDSKIDTNTDNLNDLTDTAVGAQEEADTLYWDATANKWVPAVVPKAIKRSDLQGPIGTQTGTVTAEVSINGGVDDIYIQQYAVNKYNRIVATHNDAPTVHGTGGTLTAAYSDDFGATWTNSSFTFGTTTDYPFNVRYYALDSGDFLVADYTGSTNKLWHIDKDFTTITDVLPAGFPTSTTNVVSLTPVRVNKSIMYILGARSSSVGTNIHTSYDGLNWTSVSANKIWCGYSAYELVAFDDLGQHIYSIENRSNSEWWLWKYENGDLNSTPTSFQISGTQINHSTPTYGKFTENRLLVYTNGLSFTHWVKSDLFDADPMNARQYSLPYRGSQSSKYNQQIDGSTWLGINSSSDDFEFYMPDGYPVSYYGHGTFEEWNETTYPPNNYYDTNITVYTDINGDTKAIVAPDSASVNTYLFVLDDISGYGYPIGGVDAPTYTIMDLDDTDVAGALQDRSLIYDAANNKWVPSDNPIGKPVLCSLREWFGDLSGTSLDCSTTNHFVLDTGTDMTYHRATFNFTNLELDVYQMTRIVIAMDNRDQTVTAPSMGNADGTGNPLDDAGNPIAGTPYQIDGVNPASFNWSSKQAPHQGTVGAIDIYQFRIYRDAEGYHIIATAEGGFEEVSGTAGATTLAALSDTSTTGAASGDVLSYNGTSWVPAAPTGDADPTFTTTREVVASASTGADHDCSTGHIFARNYPLTGNDTIAFTNLTMNNMDATTLTVIYFDNGHAGGAEIDSITINGNAVTVLWPDGAQTASIDGVNVVTFSVVQTSATTYLVCGNHQGYA